MSSRKESFVEALDYYLTEYWSEHGDPRAATYPLMGTFKIPLALYFTYLTLVLYLGPLLMSARSRPFNLKWLIIPHNLVLSLFNAAVFFFYLLQTRFGAELFNLKFERVYAQSNRWEHRLAYAYWLSKYVDMLDTLFLLMRKKTDQLTFMHIFHHSTVPLMGKPLF